MAYFRRGCEKFGDDDCIENVQLAIIFISGLFRCCFLRRCFLAQSKIAKITIRRGDPNDPLPPPATRVDLKIQHSETLLTPTYAPHPYFHRILDWKSKSSIMKRCSLPYLHLRPEWISKSTIVKRRSPLLPPNKEMRPERPPTSTCDPSGSNTSG